MLTILITGILAVSIALKLSSTAQSCRPLAKLYKSFIIWYLSSMSSPVTARSISLDSKARPVTSDPKTSSLGD
jgi:hypothetical protein